MRVLYYSNNTNNNGVSYDDILMNSINNDRESLLSLIDNNNNNNDNLYDFIIINNDNQRLMNILLSYCEGLNDNEDDLIIIIDINNCILINDIGQLLRLPIINRRPRFILISTLMTWDGNNNNTTTTINIANNTNEFDQRIPNTSYMNEYYAENILWKMSKLTKCEVIIVGTGLLYGGNGYDYENIMKSVFEDKSCSLLSLTAGKNKIPCIHYKILVI